MLLYVYCGYTAVLVRLHCIFCTLQTMSGTIELNSTTVFVCCFSICCLLNYVSPSFGGDGEFCTHFLRPLIETSSTPHREMKMKLVKPVGRVNLKSEGQRVSNFRHWVGCQKWSENFGKRRYCLSEASFVSAEIRATCIFGNARHTAGDFSLVSFLLVRQKKRKGNHK